MCHTNRFTYSCGCEQFVLTKACPQKPIASNNFSWQSWLDVGQDWDDGKFMPEAFLIKSEATSEVPLSSEDSAQAFDGGVEGGEEVDSSDERDNELSDNEQCIEIKAWNCARGRKVTIARTKQCSKCVHSSSHLRRLTAPRHLCSQYRA